MYTVYWGSFVFNVDPLIVLPFAGVLGALFGLGVYYGLVKYLLRGGSLLGPMLGTFGLSLSLQYFAAFVFGTDYYMIQKGLLVGKTLSLGPFIFNWTTLAAAILSLVSFLLVYYLIHRTKLGKALRATATNKEAAAYMGVNTDRINAFAWMIEGATAAIAGGLLVNFWYVYPHTGFLFSMIAFAAVALGGFGNIKGAFFAGIIIGVLEMSLPAFGNLIGWEAGAHFKLTVVYLAFIVIVVFRPQGLFGWKE
jgi:branched-chain amino acid transport system permease protein